MSLIEFSKDFKLNNRQNAKSYHTLKHPIQNHNLFWIIEEDVANYNVKLSRLSLSQYNNTGKWWYFKPILPIRCNDIVQSHF